MGYLSINLLAIVRAPIAFEVIGVISVLRTHTHQDAAFLDTFLIVLNSLFRHTPADQSADDAAAKRACTGTGDAGSQRSGNYQSQTGQNQV